MPRYFKLKKVPTMNYIKYQGLFLYLILNSIYLKSWTMAQQDLVCHIIEINSYKCEVHKVQTDDGYILMVHRISPSLDLFNSSSNQNAVKHPIILMHGLLGSAADFILPGKNRALAALLNDQGYDIWLPNARGTTYSRNHLAYNSSQAEFWNFTWHQIGTQDLPAIVDYILALTHQASLHYIAHSQGSTAFFVMLSERPDYNEKIVSAHLLAPVAFLKDLKSPPLRMLLSQRKNVDALLNHMGLHELFPSTALNQLGGHLLCGNGAPTQNLCLLLTFLTVGFSDFQMDRNLLSRILETTPAGISRKQLKHFGQLITSGKFQQYDYRSKSENYRHYKNKTPPEYNLRNVHVPLQLYYGNRDLLLTQQDVFRLVEKLRNIHYSITEVQGFNHIDLLYSTQAPRLVYESILGDIKIFTNKSTI